MNEPPLRIEPKEIKFESLEPGVLYVMTFAVRNTTKVAQRIRIDLPKTPYFALNYIPAGPIAPGLDVRAEIECQLPEKSSNNVFNDFIVAKMGPHSVEIPLYASRPSPLITFDSMINLGDAVEGQSISKTITFVNNGIAKGEITLKSEDKFSKLKFEPAVFEVPPKQSGNNSVEVTFRYEGKDLGAFREFIKVFVAGNPDPMLLDVNARVVQQKLVVLAEKTGVILEKVDFGTIFYSQERTVHAVLVNNGPQLMNFTIVYNEEIGEVNVEKDASGTSNNANEHESMPVSIRAISIAPPEGTLKPYSQVILTFVFHPKNPKPLQGFNKQFSQDHGYPVTFVGKAVIESPDLNQSLILDFKGIAATPSLTVNPSTLKFGGCPVYDRRDILITIANNSPIASDFNFSKIAQYKVNPSQGVVQPKQTVSAVVSFLPAQMGKFKNVIHMVGSNGLTNLDIKVIGDSSGVGEKKTIIGGKTVLPEDFKPNYKFVEPGGGTKGLGGSGNSTSNSTTTFKRTAPWEDSGYISSTSWDEVYDMRGCGEKSVNNDEVTYSLQQLQKKAQHKQQYEEYLQRSHKARQEQKKKLMAARLHRRGAADRSDPNGVDMGMERGLEPPELKVPLAGEPLWLERNPFDETSGRSRRIPVDENRLIFKKYSDTPSTQAEMRDCSKPLTLEDLRLVLPSHKVVNFGRICVTSVTAKNFVVTNDLHHSILVRLVGLEPELKQSKPEAQIIPGGGMAGFDLYFSCREVCKYKKFFQWTINGQYTNKLMVLAEVVPIEVNMSQNNITMAFPIDSLERTHSEQITLANPGNAAAEFMWSSAGAFQCKPDAGIIDPGKTIPIQIVWTPNPAFINEDQVGLHVVGGQDKFLYLTGNLKECKAFFEEKRLAIGTIAIGQEKKFIARINNSGNNATVFHVDDVHENLGMTITPDRGSVMPGESFEIEILVRPKVAMSYDSVGLTASIRGGKSIVLKFSGESKIPNINLVESQFKLGPVVVGSEYSVPLTLVNNSNFPASLMLDLSEHQEMRPSLDNIPLTKHVSFLSDDAGNSLEPLTNAHSVSSRVSISDESSTRDYSGLWKINLTPNSTLQACLNFIPTYPKVHNFKLPLYIPGLADKSFNREVTAEGLMSRLGVSAFAVEFGDRVVSRDPSSRMTYFKEITLTNLDQSSAGRLSFELKERVEDVSLSKRKKGSSSSSSNAQDADLARDGVTSPVYFISPMKGDLVVGESTQVRVTFLPQGHGDYSKKLDVYVSGQPDPTRPYFTLSCRGSGVFPRLSFTKHRLVLPTVPLGITSRNSFSIMNNGYDNLELKYRVSPTIPVPLTVTFPDGSDVGLTRERASVVVAAKSESPISWAGKIEFYDTDGERFSIEVCGCSDGCLLSVYPFVKHYKDRYGFVGLEEQPVIYLSKKEIASLRLQESRRKENQRKLRAQERQKNTISRRNSVDTLDTTGLMKSTRNKTITIDGKPDDEFVDDMGLFDGIDLNKERMPVVTDMECRFVLMWLNKFVCRKPFDIDNFPDCIVESNGDLVIDCIELMSGKKIFPGKGFTGYERQESTFSANLAGPTKDKSGTPTQGAGSDISHIHVSSAKLVAVDKLVQKYRAMLSFLTRAGALLTHVNPLALLGQDDFLLALEVELRKQESVRLTSAMVSERREWGSREWLQACKETWGEVLFQALKVFTLSRVTYKEYKATPGVIMQESKEESEMRRSTLNLNNNANSSSPKKKAKEKNPPHLASSNIYTLSEAVLLEWASYHLRHAGSLEDAGVPEGAPSSGMFNLDKRVVDIDEDLGTTLFGFCQIIHSHTPESTKIGNVLSGYTVAEQCTLENNFARIKTALTQCKLDFGVTLSELEGGSGRALLLLLLHLFLNLPPLIPRTTIEFRGVLGLPIVKSIELKNPSNKRVTYRVSLEGSQDFSIPSDTVVIDPNTSFDYIVTCNARFSKSVTGRLTLWGMREKGVGGTTMVFKLMSTIVDRKPVEIFKRSVSLFDFDFFQLTVTNPYDCECTFPITLYHTQSLTTVEQLLGTKAKKVTNMKKSTTLQNDQSLDAILNEATADKDKDKDKDKERDKAEQEKVEEEVEFRKLIDEPIWCTESSIRLQPLESGVITVNILPFMLGKYSVQIVLIDEAAGEFCYQVDVDVGLTKFADKIEFSVAQVSNGSSIQKALRISSKNSAFERASNIATELRLHPTKRMRAKAALQGYIASSIQNEDLLSSPFAVDFQSPYFNSHREIQFISDYCNDPRFNRPGTKRASTKLNRTLVEDISKDELTQPSMILNTVLFSFFPEKAGVYRSRVLIFGKSNELDVRMIEIVANVSAPETNTTFEFRGPAKQRLTQDIPIANDSDKDWALQSIITGKGFSGVSKLTVPKGEKAVYSLTFIGPYADTFEGALTLRDPLSNDSLEYKLIGIAEEPLAEDHLSFKCLARSKETFKIPITQVQKKVGGSPMKSISRQLSPQTSGSTAREGRGVEKGRSFNNSNIQVFRVETDLQYVTGAPTIEVGPQGAEYIMTANCPVGGLMRGSITFTEIESGIIMWYTVDVDVTSPKAESTILVEAVVRKAVAVEITIDNPTTNTLDFQVAVTGNGLLGDQSFKLPPGQTTTAYELIYSPLVAGRSVGSITFTNDLVGEFWYNLQLNAIPAEPTELEIVECMVGTSAITKVPLENPLSQSVTLSVKVSNPDNFAVIPDGSIVLEPYSQTTFDLSFRPSSLNELTSSLITLSHPAFGEMQYYARGKGLLPGNMPPSQVYTPIHEIGSHTVLFKNPFPHPLPVDVVLSETSGARASIVDSTGALITGRSVATDTTDESGAQRAFGLLLRKSSGLVIAPKGSLQIGVSFSPQRLGQYSAVVQARSNIGGRNLLWCFPIVGIAEAGVPQILPKLVTPCKTSLIKEVAVLLHGFKSTDLLPGEILNLADFSLDLEISGEYKAQVNRTFRVQPMEIIPVVNDKSTDFAVKYRLLFEPLRTMATTVQIMVLGKGRGRWRAEVELEATAPEPDDVIQLTAAVGGSDKIQFRLSNRFLGYSSFQAYFAVRSSPHFSVSPSSGVLAPYGSDGTPFVVTFAPLEYGGRQKAILNIVTDEAQWTYEVVGNYPDLNIRGNNLIRSKINNGRN